MDKKKNIVLGVICYNKYKIRLEERFFWDGEILGIGGKGSGEEGVGGLVFFFKYCDFFV